MSGLHRVVDIGTEGVERDAALLEGLAACHLGVIETAVEEHLDTLGTGTHGVTDGVAGGTAVIDTTLDLAGDAVGDDSSLHVGATYLEDIDLDLLVGDLLELFLELIHLAAAGADDTSGTCGADGDGDELEGTLDDDAGDAAVSESGIEVGAELVILVDCLSDVSLLAKPRAVPATDDAEAIAYWISLLSHGSLLVNSVITCIDIDRQIASSLTDAIATALSAGAHPLERRSLVDVDLADVELPLVGVLLILLLPVGDSTLEGAADGLGGALIRVSEDSQCPIDLHATDHIDHEAHLAGRGGDIGQAGKV